MIRPMHQQYIVKGGGSLPDPAIYCPTNGYIDPTQPNDDWLILPKVYPKNGLLYNWHAATDSRNIASAGWHVALGSDITTLQNYYGGQNTCGDDIKEAGLTYWNNALGTNASYFNARGAGYRNYLGAFGSIKQRMYVWPSDPSIYASPGAFIIYGDSSTAAVQALLKASGASIRPIKDSTTLSHGETGFYVDPSGYVYRTICIGTQEWVADNIKTQHYRNGDAIPEVTDNAAWAALTTGALCAYNNDHNNI